MDTPTVPNRLGSRSLPPLLLVRYRTAVTLVLALVALMTHVLILLLLYRAQRMREMPRAVAP